ncbi:NAD-dependent epimerase/dehydratase family protein [Noviherbaspirillum aridicola]|uniref:NAD-dependent epimerase/dehydratase domain-containing protein n=1 Tax=Noviherbaspirillum aridicola TaxID=2849687 RepID=A0ABQ4PZ96_9BURK|nr:NAD-dependent epimerase/dehydratase family protein [Noviherbaspirillum aridicola]GIZ50202.1 hypothetical protein NCCP691_02160 [Noviherbaspirillum aridicola]
MRVLVLGAAGFIGSHLAAALQAQGGIDELVLADRRPAAASGRAIVACGDIRDEDFLARLFAGGYDRIYHLAASLTLDAESDFSAGMAVNLHALMRLLEHCRLQDRPPQLLFASSISTFGGPLPDIVGDDVAQTPQTSYGTHKAIAELLISDYSRRGFLDGRVLRLPVVLTHPGPATGSVSDRIAALIRDPLGGRDAVCPLAPDTRFPVASVQAVVAAMLALQRAPASAFGASRALNLPSLSVTPREIEAALRAAGALGKLSWQADAHLQAIIDGWPRGFDSRRARALGLHADASADELVARHLETLHERR